MQVSKPQCKVFLGSIKMWDLFARFSEFFKIDLISNFIHSCRCKYLWKCATPRDREWADGRKCKVGGAQNIVPLALSLSWVCACVWVTRWFSYTGARSGWSALLAAGLIRCWLSILFEIAWRKLISWPAPAATSNQRQPRTPRLLSATLANLRLWWRARCTSRVIAFTFAVIKVRGGGGGRSLSHSLPSAALRALSIIGRRRRVY